jgi:hypothetical protein
MKKLIIPDAAYIDFYERVAHIALTVKNIVDFVSEMHPAPTLAVMNMSMHSFLALF